MHQYVVATIKSWNIDNFHKHFGTKKNFHLITKKSDLTVSKLQKINPRYIFFPHWSWIIPEEIWKAYECVTIHETDLPYGRGGSPVQNLIACGHTDTQISAIRVDAGIDTGDVYLKQSVSLKGSAQDIFKRVSDIIFRDIIPYMVEHEPKPKPQKGVPTVFKRRTPEQSQIQGTEAIDALYDHIRMLDAEEYPKAYIELGKYKIDFTNVKKQGKKLTADVEIYEKE